MREGVIGDYVSALLHFQCNVGPLANVAPDHEKRCLNVMLRQQVEQVQRMRIIGSVIECERHLLRSAWQTAKCSPEPLAPRSHGVIPRKHCRCANAEHGNQHEMIVEEPSAVSHQSSVVTHRSY